MVVDALKVAGHLTLVDSAVTILVNSGEPGLVGSGGESLGNEAVEEGLELSGGEDTVMIRIELSEDSSGKCVPVRHGYLVRRYLLNYKLLRIVALY